LRLETGEGDGHRAAVLSASEAMYSDFCIGLRSVRLPLLVKAISYNLRHDSDGGLQSRQH